jgi:hypothetical protein
LAATLQRYRPGNRSHSIAIYRLVRYWNTAHWLCSVYTTRGPNNRVAYQDRNHCIYAK